MNLSETANKMSAGRRQQWPEELILAAEGRMPVPFALKLVRMMLKFSLLVPGLTLSISYKLFFRINGKARAEKPSQLARLAPIEHWIDLKTHDGTPNKRVCCYSMGEATAPLVVLVHGWESRADHMLAVAEQLLVKGYRVVTFDLPAHGRSEGQHTDLLEINAIVSALLRGATNADANACADFKGLACEAIVAHSFGGVCATKMVADGVDCRSLVLISVPATFNGVFDKFVYLLDLSKRMQTGLKRRIGERFDFATLDVWSSFCTKKNLAELKQDVLIVHDLGDPIVPVQEGRTLFDVASRRDSGVSQQVYLSAGNGHNRILSADGIVLEVAEFIDENRRRSKQGEVGL